MAIQAVSNDNNATKIGKRIGTITGFSGSVAASVLLENEIKDVFESKAKAVQKIGYSPNMGYGIYALSIALLAFACAIGGRVIGGLIGKVVDKHNAKKAEKTE